MKSLSKRWRLIALLPLVGVAILSIGNRTSAVPDQKPAIREAANEVGIVVEGGITHGETIRFSAFHSAAGGCDTHEQMLLTVFDSQGNVVVQQLWITNPNETFHVDLNADQLPQSAFDNSGRAELIGLLTHPGGVNAGGIPGGGCVVAGEVFDNNTGRTLTHIAGTPISECRRGSGSGGGQG